MELLQIIKELVAHEQSLNDKLDVLTSISITTRQEAVLKTCEEVRSELVESEALAEGGHSKGVRGKGRKDSSSGSEGLQKSSEISGDPYVAGYAEAGAREGL